MTAAAHAPLPPSAAHRWFECPGSVKLSAGLDSSSIFADEGTFAHEIAAKALRDDCAARAFLGAKSEDGRFSITEDDVHYLQDYLDVLHAEVMLWGGMLHVEEQADVTPAVWGTADAWLLAGTVLHVYDLKWGRGVLVQALGNKQLRIYALGVWKKLSEIITEIRLHIVQPRRDHVGGIHRIDSMSPGDLQAFHGELLIAEDRVREKPDLLVPGDHCQFCAAAPTCPALRERALTHMKAAFGELPVLDSPPEALTPVHPSELAPQQLADILERTDLIRGWLKAVEDYAFHKAAVEGVVIPGYKLVDKIGNRAWLDKDHAAEILQTAGIDPLKSDVVSPAEAERRLGKGGKSLVEPLVHRPTTGVALVPETDKRPAAGGALFTMLE
jgi:Protein of unknown function (DUF2800)